MIRIIKGTFGYYDGRKIKPLTSEDGPQKLDAELEARLVKQGIAEYVGGAAQAAAEPGPKEPPEPDTPPAERPAYNKDMKLVELIEIAKAYGVDASAMRSKAEVVAAIEAAKDEEDDGEEPPEPDVVDPA